MADDEVPPGGTEVGDDPPWDAWHPREVTRRLAGSIVGERLSRRSADRALVLAE